MKKTSLVALGLLACVSTLPAKANQESTITIKNGSLNLIYGAFQSDIMTGYAADSINGWINSSSSHAYFSDDPWFNATSINIHEGDIIPKVGIFDGITQQYVTCGENVLYSGAHTYIYNGETCVELKDEAANITIRNSSLNPIYGAFQSDIMTGYAADSINGWIHSAASHVYFADDPWFEATSININEGDTIPKVGIFDGIKQQYITCAENVVYSSALTFVYDGEKCQ